MGESDRYQEYKNKPKIKFTLGQPDNALFALFAANIIGFFLILIARVFYLFTHQGQGAPVLAFDAMQWFALPAGLVKLSEAPWTILTFMFAQGGTHTFSQILTMLSNMLWLWAFGYILQNLSGNKFIFPIYIYGSLLGAIFFIAAVNFNPVLQQNINSNYLFGSQMGTVAIALSVCILSPNYRLFKHIGNGLPLWMFTALYIFITEIASFSLSGAHSFALLGSAIAGILFVLLLRKGIDLSSWMNSLYNWVSHLFTPTKSQQKKSGSPNFFYDTGKQKPFSKSVNITQQKIDEILDKISQQGYHFLTDDEKNILKKASETDL